MEGCTRAACTSFEAREVEQKSAAVFAAPCSLTRCLGLSEVPLYCGCCWGQLLQADVDSLTSMAAMLLLSAQRLLRSAPPMCFSASGRAAAASECSCSYTVLDAYRCAAGHALAHWPILLTADVARQLSGMLPAGSPSPRPAARPATRLRGRPVLAAHGARHRRPRLAQRLRKAGLLQAALRERC